MKAVGWRNLAVVLLVSGLAMSARAAGTGTEAPQLTPQGQLLNPQGTGGAAATPAASEQDYSGVTSGGGVVMHGIAGPSAEEQAANDYPTVARADYVFACMQVNGQTREVLERCACSIDVIATLLPFNDYEEAETVMSVSQRGGKAVGLFEYGPFKEKVKTLKRAQVEGELRCF
jgi:hypothetical protein